LINASRVRRSLIAKGVKEQEMPLARYLSCVGGALLALLFIVDACFPEKPASIRPEVYPPVIRIHSDQKWPERIVYDTSVPTIVPTSIADAEAIVQAPEVVAEASTGAKDRAAFAMLRPVDEQLLSSNTKMRIVKPRHQVRIVRKRVPAPRLAMVRPVSSGWFGKSFW
jgi:hypothetical protein